MDIFGKITGSKIGNQILTSNIYDSCNGLLRSTLYSSGAAVNYDYDKYGQLIQKSYTGKNAKDNLITITTTNVISIASVTQSTTETTFNYDVSERLISTHRSDGVSK